MLPIIVPYFIIGNHDLGTDFLANQALPHHLFPEFLFVALEGETVLVQGLNQLRHLHVSALENFLDEPHDLVVLDGNAGFFRLLLDELAVDQPFQDGRLSFRDHPFLFLAGQTGLDFLLIGIEVFIEFRKGDYIVVHDGHDAIHHLAGRGNGQGDRQYRRYHDQIYLLHVFTCFLLIFTASTTIRIILP